MLSVIILLVAQFSQDPGVSDYPKAIIKGQTFVPVGGAVLLDGRDSKYDAAINMVWHPVDPKDLIILTADKDGKAGSIAFFVADHAGRYEIALACAGYDTNKRLTINIDVHVVTVGNVPDPIPPNPPDPPKPLPNPDPPSTISNVKWSIIVLPTEMTLDDSQIQTSNKIREILNNKGVTLRIYYEDDKILSDRGYMNIIKGRKPPVLLLQDDKGKILTRAEVNSEKDIMDVINRIK